MPFNVGDLVRLSSGGPEMVVTHVSVNQTTNSIIVSCTWFVDGNGNLFTGNFPAAVLKAAGM